MNEQVQNAMVEFLTQAVNNIDNGVSFLSAEVPDAIAQIITWGYLSNGLTFLLSTTVLLYCAKTLTFIIKSKPTEHTAENTFIWESYGELSFEGFIIAFTSSIAIVFASMFTVATIYDLLQLALTPKVWLLEYVTHLA